MSVDASEYSMKKKAAKARTMRSATGSVIRVVLFSLLGAALVSIGPGATLASDSIPALEAEVLRRVNLQRAKKKRPPLENDARVADVARKHSQAMASRRVPPGHDGFDPRWDEVTTLLGSRTAAENVAIIPSDAKQPAEMAVDTWMKSKHHRSNLLDDYRFSGIGIARAADGKLFITHILVGASSASSE